MSPSTDVVRHPTKSLLAAASGARLITAILDAQAARGEAHVVLTGGSMGSAILAAVRDDAARDAVAWDRVSLWWGDERFLPAGDGDRNETQNREALLDAVPLDAAKVHSVAGPGDPFGDSAEDSAADYARQLAGAAGDGGASPYFDVCLLGVGPDGHVASLFPGRPELDVTDATTLAVHDSPKPPPDRVTMTFPVLNRSREVWFLVSGADKATATARGIRGDDLTRTPAAHVHGVERTLWLIDEDAAADLDA